METDKFPDIKKLPQCDREAIERVISTLFEPSPTLLHIVVPGLEQTKPGTYSTLIEAIRATLHSMANEDTKKPTLLAILGAHPRLGAQKIDSAQSQAEQASISGQNDLLLSLNEAYEEKYPGLRYVVWVNGRERSVIVDDMRQRIENGTMDDEMHRAIDEMCNIALDRLKKFV